MTKIDLLFRKKIDEEDLSGCYTAQNLRMAIGKDPQILKVKRVRDWLADFVGEAPEMKKKKGSMDVDEAPTKSCGEVGDSPWSAYRQWKWARFCSI